MKRIRKNVHAGDSVPLSDEQIKALREKWRSEQFRCYICSKTFSSPVNYKIHVGKCGKEN